MDEKLLAAAYGHEACLEILMGAGADVEAKSKSGRTAAMMAASHGHEACMELLIEAWAEFEAQDRAWARQPPCWRPPMATPARELHRKRHALPGRGRADEAGDGRAPEGGKLGRSGPRVQRRGRE